MTGPDLLSVLALVLGALPWLLRGRVTMAFLIAIAAYRNATAEGTRTSALRAVALAVFLGLTKVYPVLYVACLITAAVARSLGATTLQIVASVVPLVACVAAATANAVGAALSGSAGENG